MRNAQALVLLGVKCARLHTCNKAQACSEHSHSMQKRVPAHKDPAPRLCCFIGQHILCGRNSTHAPQPLPPHLAWQQWHMVGTNLCSVTMQSCWQGRLTCAGGARAVPAQWSPYRNLGLRVKAHVKHGVYATKPPLPLLRPAQVCAQHPVLVAAPGWAAAVTEAWTYRWAPCP